MNRRSLFSAIPLLAGLCKCAAAKLPSGVEILKSFDARDWAKAFVAHAKQIPELATDEEAMTTWFANALMRGFDEHAHRDPWKMPRTTIEELEHILAGPDHGVVALPSGEVRAAVASIKGV